MDPDKSALDEKIKSKFKLFSGVRSEEEDQEIFDKVFDLCFDEMIAFLGENLGDDEREAFLAELDKQASDEEKIKVLLTSLSKIEDQQPKLNERLDTFLDNLLSSSLANLKNE